MNRLNQTEPATFSTLLFWAFFRDSYFLYFVISTLWVRFPGWPTEISVSFFGPDLQLRSRVKVLKGFALCTLLVCWCPARLLVGGPVLWYCVGFLSLNQPFLVNLVFYIFLKLGLLVVSVSSGGLACTGQPMARIKKLNNFTHIQMYFH
jgi:hypothetical protein